MEGKRIAVIGAGPSGMSFLYHLEALRRLGGKDSVPEVVCFEKQPVMGGLWNYDWRTGLCDSGEPVHCGMYNTLQINAPKEMNLEYPDYSFKQHFGRTETSYLKREPMRGYLGARMSRLNVDQFIKCHHSVKDVQFNEKENKFSVVARDLINDVTLPAEKFDYVVNASGHFSTPNRPSFPGMNSFGGRILHSTDFRNPSEYSNLRVLVIGSSYSGEDIALKCLQLGGAKRVTVSHRCEPMNIVFPEGITRKPVVKKIEEQRVYFVDDSSDVFDVIIMATGYLHHYPYMAENLKLKSANIFYPNHLYKGIAFTQGGNGQLFYLGAQDQVYSWSMFDVQAFWLAKLICGQLTLPSTSDMEADIAMWMQKECDMVKKEDSAKDALYEAITYQTEYVMELADLSGYEDGAKVDGTEIMKKWMESKLGETGLQVFRKGTYKSRITGLMSEEVKVDQVGA